MRAFASLAWGAFAVGVALTGWLVLQGDRLARDADRLQTFLAVQTEEIALLEAEAVGTPDAAALSAQASRIAFFNALTGQRAVPLPSVMVDLAEALPQEVWLGQFSYAVETGRLAVQVRSESEGALPDALAALEAVEAFSEVILERQFRVRIGTRTIVQYDINAQVRS